MPGCRRWQESRAGDSSPIALFDASNFCCRSQIFTALSQQKNPGVKKTLAWTGWGKSPSREISLLEEQSREESVGRDICPVHAFLPGSLLVISNFQKRRWVEDRRRDCRTARRRSSKYLTLQKYNFRIGQNINRPTECNEKELKPTLLFRSSLPKMLAEFILYARKRQYFGIGSASRAPSLRPSSFNSPICSLYYSGCLKTTLFQASADRHFEGISSKH